MTKTISEINIENLRALSDTIKKAFNEGFKAGQQQILKDFVRELKEHTVKLDNERAVKVSIIERLLTKHTK